MRRERAEGRVGQQHCVEVELDELVAEHVPEYDDLCAAPRRHGQQHGPDDTPHKGALIGRDVARARAESEKALVLVLVRVLGVRKCALEDNERYTDRLEPE